MLWSNVETRNIIRLNQQNLYVSITVVVSVIAACIAGTLWASKVEHSIDDLRKELASSSTSLRNDIIRASDQNRGLESAIRADRWTATDMLLWAVQTEALNKDTGWKAAPVKPAGKALLGEQDRR